MIEAIFKLSKPLKKNALFYSLATTAFILNFFFNISAVLIILTGIVLGIIRELFNSKKVLSNG